MKKRIIMIWIGLLSLILSLSVPAQELIRIAVASNFLATLKVVTKDFTKETGISVQLVNGASGMLYAQIQKGAPYDLFFSADAKRPQRLEQEGHIVPNSRFTYVVGKLVSWSPTGDKVPADLTKLDADNPNLYFIAIANPKTSPYGVAAKQALIHYGLYDILSKNHKIALGENIGKAYQYTATHNAQIGLLAYSYIANPKRPIKGVVFEIPTNLYSPITQQAVILKGRLSPAVSQFLRYLKSDKVQQKIASYGYGLVKSSLVVTGSY